MMNLSPQNRSLKDSFFLAIQTCDLAKVDTILKQNRTTDDFTPDVFFKNTRKTALHMAVSSLDTDMVRLLLSHKADPNIHDEFGQTPLHIAAVHGGINLVRCLIEGGADVNTRSTSDGQTPIQYASALSHHDGIVAELIRGGADLGVRNDKGQNLAHLAARSGNARTAVILIVENGVHPALRDSDGRKPADLATTDIFSCLFQKWEEMHNKKQSLAHQERLKKLDKIALKTRQRGCAP